MAAVDDAEVWMIPDPDVWLTTDPEPGGGDEGFCIRVAVKIPSTDRRLITFDKWMQRARGKKQWDAARRETIMARSMPWRLYFGTIPLAAIVGAVGCPLPWWRQQQVTG
jgi:hypothetical protein